MIVDIVGVLAHQSKEAQSWQKITVKELKPSVSSPRRYFIRTTDKEKENSDLYELVNYCVNPWLCIMYPTRT